MDIIKHRVVLNSFSYAHQESTQERIEAGSCFNMELINIRLKKVLLLSYNMLFEKKKIQKQHSPLGFPYTFF